MEYINELNQKAQKAITHLESRLAKIHATGAHPGILNNIEVMYYESMTPISNMSNVKAPDALTIMIIPFEQDKKVNKEILETISKNLPDLSAVDEGHQIRVNVPPIDGEKRAIYAKEAKTIAEEAKVSVRNIRHDILKKIQNDNDLSKDMVSNLKVDIEETVKSINTKIDNHFSIKEKELLTV